MGVTRERLKTVGVETVGVVASHPERARLYYRFHPVRVPLGADPDLTTHLAYGLPHPAVTPELMQEFATTHINPTGDLPEPLPVLEASTAMARLDGFVPSATDEADKQRHFPQLVGQFLIDRDGIVRWANVEASRGGLAEAGKFPSAEELLAAVRAAWG
ncbi:MAG TPA: alkyl hydroperoxide reductase [Chloroflexota bacterium]|nr:alkyl hydroperoxide reductase [Chloroflexota bacterium]